VYSDWEDVTSSGRPFGPATGKARLGTLNLRESTMQEWTIRHHMAGMEFAGVDKSARCGKGGHCRSGQCGTIVAGVDNAGVE